MGSADQRAHRGLGSTPRVLAVERFPIITYAGAGVLAYTAGHMIVSEPLLDAVYDLSPLGRLATYAVLDRRRWLPAGGPRAAPRLCATASATGTRNARNPRSPEMRKDRRVRQRCGKHALHIVAADAARCRADPLDHRRDAAHADAPHRLLGVAPARQQWLER